MKNQKINSRFAILFNLFLLVSLGLSAQGKQLSIYCTNDLHGHVLKESRDSIIDITYAASLKKNAGSPTLLLDAGDLAYGMPIAAPGFLKDLAALLNLAGYNASTLGNHDFDGGLDELGCRIRESAFPYVSANIKDVVTKKDYLDTFKTEKVPHGASFIKQLDGLSIGIFGLTTIKSACPKTESLEFLCDDNNVGHYKELAKVEVQRLKSKGAKIIIAITHLGLPNNSQELLEIPGLDIIVDGASHEEYIRYNADSTRVLIQTGTAAQKIGEIKCAINPDKSIKLGKVRLLSFEDVRDIRIDPAIRERESVLRKKVNQMYGPLRYRMTEPLWGASASYFQNNQKKNVEPMRLTQTLLGKLWTYIMLDAWRIKLEKTHMETGKEPWVVLKNGGSFRAGLPEGVVTGTDLFQMCPNNSDVVAVKISHKTLYRLLAQSLNCLRIADDIRTNTVKNSGTFLQWKGVNGTYNKTTSQSTFNFYNTGLSPVPIDPASDKDSCMLITTSYVLNDKTYQIDYNKHRVLTIGKELDLMNIFFNEYYDPEPELPSLMEWLYMNQRINGLTVEGIDEEKKYKPSLHLEYIYDTGDKLKNANRAVNCDVRYTIYNQGKKSSHFGNTDASATLTIPADIVGVAVVTIECDIEIQLRDGRKVYSTVRGEGYLDPLIGCGVKYPAFVKLKP